MKKVDVYNIEGKKVSDFDLNDAVFACEKNNALVHQVYVAQAANRRSGSAHTKGRSDVRGGGRKPWKQKGTGNARTGSIRNPIWRGGGITFGPLKTNSYTKAINVKMKKKALLVALAEKIKQDKVIVVDSFALEDKKTKIISNFLKSMKITQSALFGFSIEEKGVYIAARNIEKVKTIETNQLNVYDILNAEYLIVSVDSMKQLESKYSI